MRNSHVKWILLTQIMLLIYSSGGIFSKLASREAFLSIRFFLYYFIVLFLLACYALGWQQVIKHLPLMTAYANKAITIVWGIIWGAFIFNEKISLGQLFGGLIVIIGIVVYARADYESD